MIKYLLIDVCTSYNILIRLPLLNELGAIISTLHLTMKFLSESGKNHFYLSRSDNSKRMLHCKLEDWQGEKCDRA